VLLYNPFKFDGDGFIEVESLERAPKHQQCFVLHEWFIVRLHNFDG
jgi:hypothetical protein